MGRQIAAAAREVQARRIAHPACATAALNRNGKRQEALPQLRGRTRAIATSTSRIPGPAIPGPSAQDVENPWGPRPGWSESLQPDRAGRDKFRFVIESAPRTGLAFPAVSKAVEPPV